MTELCNLAEINGTDKIGVYTPFYHILLNHTRKTTEKVLEIGIGTPECMGHVPNYKPGASLKMWRDYFPLAYIYGLDINPSTMVTDESRISTFICDQSNQERLQAWGKTLSGFGFDLVVDDGSHVPEHQILSAKILLPFVKKGGLYIIEDVNEFEKVSEALMPIEHTIIQFVHAPSKIGRLILIQKG